MRLFTREAWSYAVLLVVLLAIATLAVWHTISYLSDHITGEPFHIITLLLWTITLGFMLIAGAFGLWAIKFSAESESLRRISLIVDAMDYLSDGLLVLNSKGLITGSNPAASVIAGTSISDMNVSRAFTCLTNDDISMFVTSSTPKEVEREYFVNGESKSLRFRSQPTEGGLILLLVSDVTVVNAERVKRRQLARLQLIGQLARGVAHDFNNLLCAISGHASLLQRVEPGSSEMQQSINAIAGGTEKGIVLAGHLLELAQPTMAGHVTEHVDDHIHTAMISLNNSLPAGWQVDVDISKDLPPAALSGIQIEELIINLGLLAADSANSPGTIKIIAALPDSSRHVLNVDKRFASVILVSHSPLTLRENTATILQSSSDDPGIIESVLRSLIDEAGGELDHLVADDGSVIFRACLPHAQFVDIADDSAELPIELKGYLSHWSILVAASRREFKELYRRLEELKVSIESVDTITAALAKIDAMGSIDAILLDDHLLGQEAKGLLKAILKLHPSAAVVVLTNNTDQAPELTSDIIFTSKRTHPDKILASLLDARSLASHRKTR